MITIITPDEMERENAEDGGSSRGRSNHWEKKTERKKESKSERKRERERDELISITKNPTKKKKQEWIKNK